MTLRRRLEAILTAPEAVIVSTLVTAGHDGAAQLLVKVQYPNGAIGQLTLGGEQVLRLMERCGVERAADLCGLSWQHLLDALPGTSAEHREPNTRGEIRGE